MPDPKFTPEQIAAVEKWMEERARHSGVCSAFQKYRLSIPRNKKERTAQQRITLQDLRDAMSESTIRNEEEKQKFNEIIRPTIESKASEELERVTQALRETLFSINPASVFQSKEQKMMMEQQRIDRLRFGHTFEKDKEEVLKGLRRNSLKEAEQENLKKELEEQMRRSDILPDGLSETVAAIDLFEEEKK